MNDNERVESLAKSRGLDVEVWSTGGGVENIVLVLERDKSDRPVRWWMGSDCTFAEGFGFCEESDRYGILYNIEAEEYPSTDDPVAVVDFLQRSLATYRDTGRYPEGWSLDPVNAPEIEPGPWPFRSVVVYDRGEDDWVVGLARDPDGFMPLVQPDTSSRWFDDKEDAIKFAEQVAALFCVEVVPSREDGR